MHRAPNAVIALSKVDPAVVAELRGIAAPGSGDLYGRLVELFRNRTPDALLQLRAALVASAFHPARAICHKLKSSAANVGALAFSREVSELEDLCVQGDSAQAQEVLAELEAAYCALVEELTVS